MNIQSVLFKKNVEPTLLYACEGWSSCNFKPFEIFNRIFVRCFKSTNTCMMYDETGRRHLKCDIEKRMVNY